MLVLSRQRDESIIIGDDIVVTIVDVRGDKVKLGIDAPQDVSVHRREVYEAIRRENQHAARLRPDEARGISRGPLPDRREFPRGAPRDRSARAARAFPAGAFVAGKTIVPTAPTRPGRWGVFPPQSAITPSRAIFRPVDISP